MQVIVLLWFITLIFALAFLLPAVQPFILKKLASLQKTPKKNIVNLSVKTSTGSVIVRERKLLKWNVYIGEQITPEIINNMMEDIKAIEASVTVLFSDVVGDWKFSLVKSAWEDPAFEIQAEYLKDDFHWQIDYLPVDDTGCDYDSHMFFYMAEDEELTQHFIQNCYPTIKELPFDIRDFKFSFQKFCIDSNLDFKTSKNNKLETIAESNEKLDLYLELESENILNNKSKDI